MRFQKMASDSDLRVNVFMLVDLDVFPKVCDEDAERLVAVSNFGGPREFVQTFEYFLLHVEHGNVGSAFGEIADNLAPELSCPMTTACCLFTFEVLHFVLFAEILAILFVKVPFAVWDHRIKDLLRGFWIWGRKIDKNLIYKTNKHLFFIQMLKIPSKVKKERIILQEKALKNIEIVLSLKKSNGGQKCIKMTPFYYSKLSLTRPAFES